jgi:hypothetical protein
LRVLEGMRPTSEQSESDSDSEEDRPRNGVEYLLEIDGNTIRGTTDDEGTIETQIPPNARRGRLTLAPGTPNEEEIEINIGHMNPISETSGVMQRLNNLGFHCGDEAEESSPELEAAIRRFQERYDLEVTGELDQTTRDRISEVHGS